MSVLVVLERTGGKWNPVSREALAAAQQIATDLGTPVVAAVLGHDVTEAASELVSTDLARVYAVDHELLKLYTADGYTVAIEALIRQVTPEIVLFPHTYQVRDFAPKLATRFGQVLVSDIIRYRIQDGDLILVRQLFQGKLLADVHPAGPMPRLISVQAGAFRAEDVRSGTAEVETFRPELIPETIRVRPEPPFREAGEVVDLTSAGVIVAAGRGVRDKDDLALIEELARQLGAEVAASRPVCDNGWLPMDRQVGSSGQIVSPKLYVAVGISGAIQHIVGMKSSQTIVAINKDPDAPIFEVADYGIAGDLYDVVPALIEELKKANTAG